TVLIPSLPPSSWTTTRMRPSRSGRAAIAVRVRKPGTTGASDSRAERCKSPRRVSMGNAPTKMRERTTAPWKNQDSNRSRVCARSRSGQLRLASREQPGDGPIEPSGLRAFGRSRQPQEGLADGRVDRSAHDQLTEEPQGVARVVSPTVACGQAEEVGRIGGGSDMEAALGESRGEVGAGDDRPARQPASATRPAPHIRRIEEVLPPPARPPPEQERAGGRGEAVQGPPAAEDERG